MAIIIIRTVIIYTALLAAMRLLGKRQLGEMELSEFVVAALIADLAAHPLQDLGIPMINGLVPILTLFCCEVLISRVALKSTRARAVLYGKPSMIIEKGVISQSEMAKNNFTTDELMQELRNQGCLDISKIEYAVLETDGRLNVMLYPLEKPVTAGQMKAVAEGDGYPMIVISDGQVLEENLAHLSLDRKWLEKELKKHSLSSARQVFLMTVNEQRKVYLAGMEAAK